jgi:hypothetical protein
MNSRLLKIGVALIIISVLSLCVVGALGDHPWQHATAAPDIEHPWDDVFVPSSGPGSDQGHPWEGVACALPQRDAGHPWEGIS